MTTRTQHKPPNINQSWLREEMMLKYPNHRGSAELKTQIDMLVHEYTKFWHLLLAYPEKRIVGTGAIIATQKVHWSDTERYFNDSMGYFNVFKYEKTAWGGRLDIKGTMDTVRSYQELFEENPSSPWQDMFSQYNLKHSHLELVSNH